MVHHPDCSARRYEIIYHVEPFKPLQPAVTLKVNDRPPLGQRHPILQPAYHIGHVVITIKLVKPAQDVDCTVEQLNVVARQRQPAYRVIRVGVTIVFSLIHLYGSFVAEAVGTHHLQVKLHGAHTHLIVLPLILVQRVGTCINEILQSPSPGCVAQTTVNGVIA